ncbi:MspA family porin [Corynebacterium falsenii]|uniref:MspA family porin n=1 Tax=Corynebacterium falsenii TaxID=108486 RepID=UPI003FD34B47
MKSRVYRGVVAGVSSVLVALTADGVASAAPQVGELVPWPGAVFGGEKPLADRELARTTADGWVLHAKKSDELINLAPPLDGAATTGEAFGSLNGKVWIDGAGDPALTGAQFEMGYQIGCGVDVSSGADVEVASTVGVASHANVGVEGGPSVQVEVPNTTGAQVGADATGKAEAGAESKAEVSPTVAGHLNPGKVTNVALATMPISNQYKRASGGFTGAHLQINGCAGPVSIRSYVQIATVSPTSMDVVAVYGDPQRIR